MAFEKGSPYADIIQLPHHISATRPKMSMQDRAAQFSPFAALTGYDDAVNEAARLTEQRIELDHSELELLDRRFRCLSAQLNDHPVVRLTYFCPDLKKEGGAYVPVTGAVQKIDIFNRLIVMADGTRIPMDDIRALEIE